MVIAISMQVKSLHLQQVTFFVIFFLEHQLLAQVKQVTTYEYWYIPQDDSSHIFLNRDLI